jgi:hypothetical protein
VKLAEVSKSFSTKANTRRYPTVWTKAERMCSLNSSIANQTSQVERGRNGLPSRTSCSVLGPLTNLKSLIGKLPSLAIGSSERIVSHLGVVLERLICNIQHLATVYVNNKVKAFTIRHERP